MTNLTLSENLEDYLETILELEKRNKVARAKDIAEKLGVKRASVTGALKSLADKGLIHYAPYSYITLTEAGSSIAEDVTRKHRILKKFLEEVLQLDDTIADETACRMEHVIDGVSFERLVTFLDALEKCPRGGEDWLTRIVKTCQQQWPSPASCRACLETCGRKLSGS